jgi:hypothetical protein
MNLLPTPLSLLNAVDMLSPSSTPISLSERMETAMQERMGDDPSGPPEESKPENPFLTQFKEWMFYGEPEETGIETLEPYI